jgi:hypothetical protein
MLPLLFVGLAIFMIGGFMFLIAAFRESVLWGLACLFVPIVPLFFLITHWHEAKKPFAIQLIGLAILILIALVSPGTIPIRH